MAKLCHFVRRIFLQFPLPHGGLGRSAPFRRLPRMDRHRDPGRRPGGDGVLPGAREPSADRMHRGHRRLRRGIEVASVNCVQLLLLNPSLGGAASTLPVHDLYTLNA